MTAIVGPLKWHGGKQYLAERFVERIPPHVHYVEPYAGGLAVLLAKPCDGVSEVVNDRNGELTNFWSVLRDEEMFARFHRIAAATPFSEPQWLEAKAYFSQPDVDPVRRAFHFFVLCRQSMAGRMVAFAPLSRTRTRRNMNEQASAWWNVIEGLPAVHARLKRVVILNRPAHSVIAANDGPGTFFYLDPPYLHETRTTTYEYGDHEMSVAEHEHLLELLGGLQGKFMLSGYPSAVYDIAAKRHGWTCTDFELPNNAASGERKRRMVECIWTNYDPAACYDATAPIGAGQAKRRIVRTKPKSLAEGI